MEKKLQLEKQLERKGEVKMGKSKYQKANYYAVIMKTAEKTGLTKSEINKTVMSFVESIKEYVGLGFMVNIKNLGKFYSLKKKARKARNPRTGQPIDVPERRVVKYGANRDLAASVKKSINE